MAPSVDIIILNHNTWRHTVECLESVLRSDYPAFRVIISDNGSSDGSLDELRSWLNGDRQMNASDVPSTLRHLVEPPVAKPISFVEGDAGSVLSTGSARVVILRGRRNAGFAGGNNVALQLGLDEGRASFAWILNNDTIVATDCLTKLVEAAGRGDRVGAVGATLLEYFDPETVQAAAGGTISETTGTIARINQSGIRRDRLDRISADFNFVSCCSMLVRTEVLANVGLLDERFFIYAEDGDFGLRIARSGWRLGYAADALVWHKGSQTTVRGSPFNDYHHVRSSLLFVRKWHRGRLPVAFGYWLYRALAPKLFRGQWRRVSAVMRAFYAVIREGRPV